VTGRFGYAANDWLFYGKAGGAWMSVFFCVTPNSPFEIIGILATFPLAPPAMPHFG